ncbi:MAG: tetratricopeptide repeat protein [Gemmatimonadales bacterium]
MRRSVIPIAVVLSLAGSLPLGAQAGEPLKVRTVTDTLIGSVGGVAVDRLGVIFAADFGDRVYRIEPDGRTSVLAAGLYGASGNAIDASGRLLQSNFHGNSIVRIDRRGEVEPFAEGLEGPVGIAVAPDGGLTVCNCRGNSLARVSPDGSLKGKVTSPLFNCPNGITRSAQGDEFVVNYADGRMLRVTSEGQVSQFAVIPGGGNGHVAELRGAFYVTSFRGHRIYRVSREGEVSLVAGDARPGEVDGAGLAARFTFPNGIAAGPTGDRLFVNDFVNRFPPNVEAPPTPRSIVRQITLPSLSEVLAGALAKGGVAAMEARYRAWKKDPATALHRARGQRARLPAAGLGNVPAAEALLRLNTESYPGSFNVWDSYAEALMSNGKRDEAIKYYRKSLELNPGNDNAVTMLAKLGVEP